MSDYKEWSKNLNNYLFDGKNRDDSGISVSFLMSPKEFSSEKFSTLLTTLKENGFSFNDKVGKFISPVGCFNFDKKLHEEINFDQLEINNVLFGKFQSIIFGFKPFYLRYDKSIDIVVISVWVDEAYLLEHPDFFNEWIKATKAIAENFHFIIGFQWGGGSSHDYQFNLEKLIDFFKNPGNNFWNNTVLNRFYLPIMFWGSDFLIEDFKEKLAHAPADQLIQTKNGIGLVFMSPKNHSPGKAYVLKKYFEK